MSKHHAALLLLLAIVAGIAWHLSYVRPHDRRVDEILACMGADQSRERYAECVAER